MEHNEGVVVSGGKLTANAMAVGRRATATAAGSGSGVDAELTRRLDALLELVDRYSASLPDAADIRSTTHGLQEEITKPQPNRITIRGLLAGLTEAVGTVTPLVTAVEALKVALSALL